MEHEGSLSELETLIGYTFQDIKHLETAITHKSFVNERWSDAICRMSDMSF